MKQAIHFQILLGFVVFYVIIGVILHYCAPFLHYLTTLSSDDFLYVVLGAAAISIIYGIINYCRGMKDSVLFYFILGLVIIISMLPHAVTTEGKYYNGLIIKNPDSFQYGVLNKWGKTVFPVSVYESFFFVKNDDSKTTIIGIDLDENTERGKQTDRILEVIQYINGDMKTVSKYRMSFSSEKNGPSLYSFIKENYGFPLLSDLLYVFTYDSLYITNIEEIE